MIGTIFFLDTTREIFESWLVKTWKPVEIPTQAGTYHLQDARRGREKVRIDAWWVSIPDEEDTQTALPIGQPIIFEAIPLASERIEVRGTCTSETAEPSFLDLLDKIGVRWPESGLTPVDQAATATDEHGLEYSKQDEIRQRRQWVKDLVNERKTVREIARHLGRSRRTIERDKEALGLTTPP